MPEPTNSFAQLTCMNCGGGLSWNYTKTDDNYTEMSFTCDVCQWINDYRTDETYNFIVEWHPLPF